MKKKISALERINFPTGKIVKYIHSCHQTHVESFLNDLFKEQSQSFGFLLDLKLALDKSSYKHGVEAMIFPDAPITAITNEAIAIEWINMKIDSQNNKTVETQEKKEVPPHFDISKTGKLTNKQIALLYYYCSLDNIDYLLTGANCIQIANSFGLAGNRLSLHIGPVQDENERVKKGKNTMADLKAVVNHITGKEGKERIAKDLELASKNNS